MKLSIIIRCYNRLEYTIRTIESIDRLSGFDKDEYEIICVDQNSKDGTREWLLSASREGYYPIVPVLLEENVGDGRGMNEGFNRASGEFIAQHDNDIMLITDKFYSRLISIYSSLESLYNGKVCSVAGSHSQGVNRDSAPMRFAKKKYPNNEVEFCLPVNMDRHLVYVSAWVTAAFIFRKKFTSLFFGKGMCNSWCGEWWDQGYNNFVAKSVVFWHIDSNEKGGEFVRKQMDKFPSYTYVKRHYRSFIKEEV